MNLFEEKDNVLERQKAQDDTTFICTASWQYMHSY